MWGLGRMFATDERSRIQTKEAGYRRKKPDADERSRIQTKEAGYNPTGMDGESGGLNPPEMEEKRSPSGQDLI